MIVIVGATVRSLLPEIGGVTLIIAHTRMVLPTKLAFWKSMYRDALPYALVSHAESDPVVVTRPPTFNCFPIDMVASLEMAFAMPKLPKSNGRLGPESRLDTALGSSSRYAVAPTACMPQKVSLITGRGAV